MQQPAKLDLNPQGFSTLVTNCGIKDKTLDLGIVYSQTPCTAAAIFTKNKVAGNPVLVGRKHIKKGLLHALVVNSKNSNVATGKAGYDNALKVCKAVAGELSVPVHSIFPSSTGIIARPLPVDKILGAVKNLPGQLQSPADFEGFARAIMTTDTFPKFVSRKVGKAVLVGVCKGSGMIEPNMATMLAYFFTDAKLSSSFLDKCLRQVADKTFNSLSVDSDTSTSDTACIMANGLAGEVDKKEFLQAFEEVATELTRLLARDGEGATKLFTVDVIGAKNDKEAKKIGKSIINSPLIKTAIYKGDPNFGRIYMAVGKTPGVKVKPDKIRIMWGKPAVSYADNQLAELSEYLKSHEELYLTVDLQLGKGSWRVYGCDLTEEYVKINAYYST